MKSIQSKQLRSGFTTGACASAASTAAVMALLGEIVPEQVKIQLPECSALIPVHKSYRDDLWSVAEVVKDAGDDPDITDGVTVRVHARWNGGDEITIEAGEGVGHVTKPGLSVKPGMPAINPGPRKMIEDSIRKLTDKGVEVVISIPGGAELAKKTFNPRLGIVGGLSILGTTGIVKPFSCDAIRETLVISMNLSQACGIGNPVLVPGRIGEKAAKAIFRLREGQLIETGNEWGFILDKIVDYPFAGILIVGHAGKLAKLPMGQWDTHSSRSSSALPYVLDLASQMFKIYSLESTTVEGLFKSLKSGQERLLSTLVAERIQQSVIIRTNNKFQIAVTLVDMTGKALGSAGDHSLWERR